MQSFQIRYRNTQGTLMRILNAASRRALDIPTVHAEADGSDHQVRGGLAAAAFRQTQAQVAGLVGAPLHLGDQIIPFLARDAVVVPIGARVLAAMVEKLHILAFERLDLRLDERIQLGELLANRCG